MELLRTSATVLDAYRLWLEPDQEWMTEDDLLATIRGEVVPSRQMALGGAFHRILETPDAYRVKGGYVCGDFSFSEEQLRSVFDRYDRRGVGEVKATIELDGCALVAQADLLHGSTLAEFKTTSSYSFDPEKYMASHQWRVMSLVFQPQAITYHIASVDDHENGVVEIRWVESFTVYPYPALKDDVRALLASFKSYVTSKGLDEFLRERQRTAAA